MYLQIMEQIRQRVAIGEWLPGDEIPSIRQLAIALKVSVITVKRAYLELEREGVILTQHGKGSVISPDADLTPRIFEQELDEHLQQAARLTLTLGISEDVSVSRLRSAIRFEADTQVNSSPLTEEPV